MPGLVPIEYDSYGRMMYNPRFHKNNRKVWEANDLDYLANWYDIIGPEEMSFALERTIKSVMQKIVSVRRKKDLPITKHYIKRIRR